MRGIDFSNIGELFDFHSEKGSHTTLLAKARSGRSMFLVNDDRTAYLCYDQVFGGKWAGHVHSKPSVRGKELWDFSYETALWMVKNAEMTQLLCFVKSDDRLLKIFVKQFKMPLIGVIGDENLYAVDDETIIKFKEVELCQQQ